jgi:hypothetical protein
MFLYLSFLIQGINAIISVSFDKSVWIKYLEPDRCTAGVSIQHTTPPLQLCFWQMSIELPSVPSTP